MFCIISKRSILSPSPIDELSNQHRILGLNRILKNMTPRVLGWKPVSLLGRAVPSSTSRKAQVDKGVTDVNCSEHMPSLPHITEINTRRRGSPSAPGTSEGERARGDTRKLTLKGAPAGGSSRPQLLLSGAPGQPGCSGGLGGGAGHCSEAPAWHWTIRSGGQSSHPPAWF